MAKLFDENGVLYLWQKIKTLLGGKVDKIDGKGLSSNDYTTEEKTKLAGIAAGANKYTLPTASKSTLGGVKTGSDVTDATGYTAAPIIGGIPYYKDTNTTYSGATTSASGLMSAADKAKLDGIETGANKYTLPAAGSSLGGVKTTSTVTDATGYTAAPIIDGVPYYKDTNTTYSAMTAATSSTAGKTGLVPAPAAGAQAKYLRGDGTWQTPPNTTYSPVTTSANGLMIASDKAKLDGIEAGANNYSLPTASKSTLGGVKTGSDVTDAAGYTPAPIIGGIPYYKDTNTTYSTMTAATASAAGKAGLVPAPAAGKQGQYLRGDGTWATPTNTTYGVATSSANGLMSSSDKAKLDAFGAAGSYALKSDLTNVYKYKGSVATVSALPASGQTAGDVYNVESSNMNYAWNGSAWDPLGEVFTIETLSNADIDAIIAQVG